MISFFRKALSSWLVLGLLGLIMIAFIITGVSNRGLGEGEVRAGGTTIATIGRQKVGSLELQQRVQAAFRRAQQDQNGLTMAQFINGGGFEQVVETMLAGTAVEQFGRKQGLTASRRMVDGEIASIPGFRGLTGQFDENAMRAVLREQGITEQQLRQDVASDGVRRQLLVPINAASHVPGSLVLPYASLLLEERQGWVGIVPAAAMAGGDAPSQQEIDAWYRAHQAAYTVPERRVMRYAVVGTEQVAEQARPTEAELAAAYKAAAASYAPAEKRDITQIVADSEAKAQAFAAAIKAGTPFEKAAAAARLTPSRVAAKTKAELTDLASPDVANAVFGAAKGGVTAPARSAFGWHVARVDAIAQIAGRTLDQVRGELTAKLAAEKTRTLITEAAQKIDDGIEKGANFDELLRAQKLVAVTTPALTANGDAPDQPDYQVPADVRPLLPRAFDMTADDDPVVATIVPSERFAVLAVTSVVPAAARPLAQVRDKVVADIIADRGQKRARAVAEAIAAKAGGGQTLAAAFAAAPVKLGVPLRAGGRRADLTQQGKPVPPPLQLLFSLAPGQARVLAAPGNQGWFVVKLDSIKPGDARSMPSLVEATRGQFSRVVGDEYVSQFANAARAALGMKVDTAAIARLKGELAGGAAQP
ncbi:peptidylprolyl isomerase [Sphingomonas quercus]|uniref:SurA N-terminal domain-containing protein n=1 Tax=Sphingomonas quercus TaxID=2842451 RepID=A0ABS6BIX5_9SPHN|nr:peptidylprolyl isomerase [Sphingomonas quercus]MBU3078257.1 SurA N-terminal domain-containing protein [Sphingomonas quercus]